MRILAITFVVLLLALTPARASEDRVLVFGAASLTEALNDVGKAYAQTGKPAPTFSFAASSALVPLAG